MILLATQGGEGSNESNLGLVVGSHSVRSSSVVVSSSGSSSSSSNSCVGDRTSSTVVEW